ncbi:MAG: hypothetical protein Q8P18_07430 [Pseudomonadota bacterium]|nr:hypothetical protein [Pseudomonadota bacterium]
MKSLRTPLHRGELVAHASDGILGCLVPAGAECESLVEGWVQGEEVMLVLSAGGASRPTLRVQDLVWNRVVRFEREGR